MTTGEKIKKIRNKFGLSQEELAERLNVSRQAITKWEGDNGLPDVGNLKQLSNLFGITIDYLLDNKSELPLLVMREKIDLDNYDKNKYKDKYEAILKAKYPKPWKIEVLMREKKMTKLEACFDFFIGAGTLELADALGNKTPYYLVSKNNIHLLVNVTKDYIEAKELTGNFNEKEFVIGKNKFIKLNIEI